jgi:hypothetical protein
MALSLEVLAGSEIKIGKSVLRVLEVIHGTVVNVMVGDRKFVITEEERTEVLPEVFVSCGVKPGWNKDERSRLAFEAPIDIRINRLDGVRT